MYAVLESKKQWGDFQPNVIPLVNKYKHSILFRIIFQKPLAYMDASLFRHSPLHSYLFSMILS